MIEAGLDRLPLRSRNASLEEPTQNNSGPDPLYGRWVEHDTNRSAKRSRRKRVSELRPHNAGIAWIFFESASRTPSSCAALGLTMWSGNLAPNYSDLRSPFLLLGPVDIG